jgi:hypothetical protein
MDCSERRMRLFGGKFAECGKREVAAGDSARNGLQRADFWR